MAGHISYILTQLDFLERAHKVHGNRYDYSKSIYAGNKHKVLIICNIHGPFNQSPEKHWTGQGCSKCGRKKTTLLRTKSFEDFVEEASKIHNNKYGYYRDNYINSKSYIEIECPIHNRYPQNASDHLQGYGCSECQPNFKDTYETFCEKANKIHNNLYNYKDFVYVNSKTKGIIHCSIHGPFEQKPYAHLSMKQGCFTCGGRTPLTQEVFLKRAKEMHGAQFDYSQFIYTTYDTKGTVICSIHGPFDIKPAKHLGRGDGCPDCGGSISKGETKWLDSLNLPNIIRNKQIIINGKQIRPDAFDPTTNTLYEFNGDYWHGNPMYYDQNKLHPKVPKTFGELYQATLNREKLIKDAGYNLVSIWESDFLGPPKKPINK